MPNSLYADPCMLFNHNASILCFSHIAVPALGPANHAKPQLFSTNSG